MNIDRFRDSPHLSDVPISHPCPTDPTCPYCNGSIDTHSKIGFNWSFVDGVYCISLNTRGDRTASAAAQFHRVGLCRYVLFYRPTKHPKSTVIGIWNSHRTVGEHARQRGCLRAMIFEDDVLFTHHLRPQRLRAIARALDTLPPDWMIFFLGHWPLSGYFVRPNVLKTNSACAHAYITSSRLLEWLQATHTGHR